jgi:hypothetical protein
MMLVGHARGSTQEQDLALQREVLKSVGCSRVLEEKASGMQRARPELKAVLEYVRKGKTPVVLTFSISGKDEATTARNPDCTKPLRGTQSLTTEQWSAAR